MSSLSCGTWALFFALHKMQCKVFSCGTRCCPVACGILVPQPRIEPVSPALEGRFLTTGLPGKSLLLMAYGYSQVSASFFFKESGSKYFQLHGPYDLYPKYSVSATAAAKVAIDNMQMMRLHSNKTLLTQTGSMPPPGLSHGCTHLINIY